VAAVADVAANRRREPSLGIRLLADIKTAMGDLDAISTDELLSNLNGMEESPWGDLKGGKGLDARGLAALLKKYGVVPKGVRRGDKTPKGYRREHLHDAWTRYLPDPMGAATSATSDTDYSELDTGETF
jgi:hypothetical protein